MFLMRCPVCAHVNTRVLDSRPVEAGAAIRRRRICEGCTVRFTTYERVHALRLVRKRSGHLEPFLSAKLRKGVEAALADRPVAPEAVDELIDTVEQQLGSVAGEVDSDQIGKLVLEELRRLDEVAYMRFASVYKEFQAVGDFERELAELEAITRSE